MVKSITVYTAGSTGQKEFQKLKASSVKNLVYELGT